jgi:hypothetical protein
MILQIISYHILFSLYFFIFLNFNFNFIIQNYDFLYCAGTIFYTTFITVLLYLGDHPTQILRFSFVTS